MSTSLFGLAELKHILVDRVGLPEDAVPADTTTTFTDPSGVTEVRDAVVDALDRTGATAVIVEHRLDAWAPHVDRVVVLEPGGGVAYDGIGVEAVAVGATLAVALPALLIVVAGRRPPRVEVIEPARSTL